MSQLAIHSINEAMKAWRQAQMVSPPCPVFTQLAIAHYNDAKDQIGQRIIAMEEVISRERSG